MTTQFITALSIAAIITSAPISDLENDRSFHPDYSHALSVEQMTAAWNAEINRLIPVPISGGG